MILCHLEPTCLPNRLPGPSTTLLAVPWGVPAVPRSQRVRLHLPSRLPPRPPGGMEELPLGGEHPRRANEHGDVIGRAIIGCCLWPFAAAYRKRGPCRILTAPYLSISMQSASDRLSQVTGRGPRELHVVMMMTACRQARRSIRASTLKPPQVYIGGRVPGRVPVAADQGSR